MKKCARCGAENGDDAVQCRECGTTAFLAGAPVSDATSRLEKVAALAHEVEAERLGVELSNRGIPHFLRSYHDSALDGLYQLGHGWGHVEAPSQYKEDVLAILRDIRQGVVEAESDASEGANPNAPGS